LCLGAQIMAGEDAKDAYIVRSIIILKNFAHCIYLQIPWH
jgi:hypothetical protein